MTVKGLDYCWKWWGVGKANVMKKRGIQFAIIRVGAALENGKIEIEPYWKEQVEDCHSQGVLTAAYWYYLPSLSNWTAQIDTFISELMSIVDAPWKPLLPPFIDFEKSWTPRNKNTDRMRTFVQRLKGDLDGKFNVKRPGVYTNANFWNNYTDRDEELEDTLLWISRYNNAISGPWSDGKYQPRDWVDWTFWQYSANGNGLGRYYGFYESFINRYGQTVKPSANADLNVFNGTRAELYALAGIEMPPPPPPRTWEDRLRDVEEYLAQSQGYEPVVDWGF